MISREAIERVDAALAAGAAAVATIHAGAIKAAAAAEEQAARNAVLEKPADDFPCCSPGSTAHAPREITHAVMCGVGSSGSCFVPWCTCECHLRSSDVALAR